MRKKFFVRFLIFIFVSFGVAFINCVNVNAWVATKYTVVSKYAGSQIAIDKSTSGGDTFAELVTEQKIDDTNPDYVTIRYRYYQYHKGKYSSWQTAPVALRVDGKIKEKYDVRKLGKFSNGYVLCGYTDVKLKRGTKHTIELVQLGSTASDVAAVTLKVPRTYDYPKYTVKFVDWNSTVLKSQSLFRYGNATPPANPSRTGYTFTGWNGTYTNVTSNRTITATYKINTYTVTFKDWNGTVLKTQSVNYGSSATPPANPSRTGYTFTGWSGTYTNVTSNRTITATYKPKNYTLSVNPNGGVLKGSNFGSYNGTSNTAPLTVTYGTSNYYALGTATRTGHTFQGFYTSGGTKVFDANGIAVKGTGFWDANYNWIYDGNLTVYAKWERNTYTNYIYHYYTGFQNGEGNADGYQNTGKLIYWKKTMDLVKSYNDSYTIGSGNAITIPKGYYLATTNVGSSYSGSWLYTYSLPMSVTQPARAFGTNFKYNPYNYTISYDLNGGSMPSGKSNPSSYNILYGVTFNNPTRKGYTFVGWKDTSTGKIITGINEGANAKFSSIDDMYSKLSTRSIGNVSVQAQWINHDPEIEVPVIKDDTNNNVPSKIPPFIDGNNVIIQKGDPFDPLDFVKATDEEDGDISDRIVVKDNPVPYDKDGNTTTSGSYTVTVQVTDDGGKTVTGTVHVIVNDPPKLSAKERWFYTGETVGTTQLLEKVTATDKEDGNIKSKVVITSIKNLNNVELAKDKIDTTDVGKYIVTYQVTDKYKKMVTCQATINVTTLDVSHSNYTMRYISKEQLSTLNPNSKWAKNSSLFNSLTTSLNKEATDANALYVIEFNSEQSDEMKSYILNSVQNKELNKNFLNKYSNIFKKKPTDGSSRMK